MRSIIVCLATNHGPTRRAVEALTNELSTSGRNCTLLWILEVDQAEIQPPQIPHGISLRTFRLVKDEQEFIPFVPLLAITRQIVPILDQFDVVYGFVAGHPTMQSVRARRFSQETKPFFVAIVDDPKHTRDVSAEVAESSRKVGEAYVIERSDLTICFHSFEADYPWRPGAEPPARSDVLQADLTKLPKLFDDIEMKTLELARARVEATSLEVPIEARSLTIVVSLCDSAKNRSAVFHALDKQTCSGFSVIAVDNGTSPGNSSGLEEIIASRRQPGWTVRRELCVGEASAIALALRDVSSEFLIFIDANDSPHPSFVEELLRSARRSGDDLLELWSYEVAECDDLPPTADVSTGAPAAVVNASYGIDPVAMLRRVYDKRPVFLIKKSVFDSIGGYPQGLVAGREREALAARVAMAGYRTDVLPRVLNTRYVTSALIPGDILSSGNALRDVFDERLNTANFHSFATVFQSIDQQSRIAEQAVEQQRRQLSRRFTVRGQRDRLRLLMVVSSFPYPPMTGCLLRWWAMIRFLGERHDLTLATFCSSAESLRRHELLRYCRSIYAASPDGARLPGNEELPFLVRARSSVNMRDALRSIPTEFYDAAIIEQIFLAPFRSEINCPVVLGEHNIESRILMQIAGSDPGAAVPTPGVSNAKRESTLMRDYEDNVWPHFNMRTAVNPGERDEIERRSHGGRTVLVENGTSAGLRLPEQRTEPDRIAFFGMLGYYPNIDGIIYFWRNIWPHLVRLRPSVELVVAGSSVTSELRDLAKEPGFILIEDPPDIRDAAMMASVSIVPLRVGAGTRLKILDSMALGLPVVSTSLGCEGLAVEDEVHILIRDDAVEFAEAVDRLLASSDLRARLRRNGKAIIDERYEWNKTLLPLESALLSIAR